VLETLLRARGVRPCSRLEVLLDRELAEDLAALRYEANAAHCARFCGLAVDALAGDLDLSLRCEASHDAAQERRLADTVAAHHHHAFALLHVEIDVPERVALAVELVEACDAEKRAHGQCPK
jgi:hypothetical protein